MREQNGLEPLARALRHIHFPEDDVTLARARESLAFEELFHLQAVLELRKRVLQEEGRGLITAGPGALAFCAVVVLTMLASMQFDPRLIWDATDSNGEKHA